MPSKFYIKTPISSETEKILTEPHILDNVFISPNSKVLTLRDASGIKLINDKNATPINFRGAAIYFCAPSYISPETNTIGSCGPTTSARLAKYIPYLINKGAKIFIGKGPLPEEILTLLKKHKCLYLLAVGGAGAYYNQFIKSCKVIAYPELGPEAILELTISSAMPLLVGADTRAEDAFTFIKNKKIA